MNPTDSRKYIVRMEQSNESDHKKAISEYLARACRAISEHPERYVPDGFFTADYPHEIIIRVPVGIGSLVTVETNVESLVVDD